MIKIIVASSLLTVTVLFCCCSKSKETAPSETVRAFYVAANEGRYADAVGYLNKTAAALHQGAGPLAELTLDKMAGKGKEIETITIIEELIQGEEATVTIEVRFRDRTMTTRSHPLTKEEGAWKIGRLNF